MGKFRTNYLTKERSYVSTQQSGQLDTFLLESRVKGACDVMAATIRQSVQDDARVFSNSHTTDGVAHVVVAFQSCLLIMLSEKICPLSPSTAAHLEIALPRWMRRPSAIPAIAVPIVGMRAIDDARDVPIVASERHVHLAVVKPWDFLQVAHHVVGP